MIDAADDAFARWRAARPENRLVSYSTRSSAVRAAREACRKALESPVYQAYEGPDFAIHPVSQDPYGLETRFRYELRGPALDAMQATEAAKLEHDEACRRERLALQRQGGGTVLVRLRDEELHRGPDGASLGIVSYHERSVHAAFETIESVLAKDDEVARLCSLLLLVADADRAAYRGLIGETRRRDDEPGRSLTVLLEIAALADAFDGNTVNDFVLDEAEGLQIAFRYAWSDPRPKLLAPEALDRIEEQALTFVVLPEPPSPALDAPLVPRGPRPV